MAFSSDNTKVFLTVLDTGSFSAAARSLGRVPSAVSMTISQLEAELDLSLFDRSHREPRPTELALALEPLARQVESQLRLLQTHALALHQGLETKLTIAIAPELVTAPWSGPLASLAQEFPTLEVEVLSAPQADAIKMLHTGEAQLALVFERPSLDEREDFWEVGSEGLITVIAPQHPLVSQGRSHLRQSDLVGTRQIALSGRESFRADPRVLISHHIWRTDSYLTTLRLVEAGLGWAFLPKSLVQPMLASGTLQEIRLENMGNELKLFVDVVWLKDRPQGLGAKRFLHLIREQAQSQK